MSERPPSNILPWATAGVLLLLSALIAVAASAGSRDPERPSVEGEGLPTDGGGTPEAVAAPRAARPEIFDSPLRVRVEVQDHGLLLPPPSPVFRDAAIQRGSAAPMVAKMRFRAGPCAAPGLAMDSPGRSLAQLEFRDTAGTRGSSFCRIVAGEFASGRPSLVIRDEVVVEGRVVRAMDGEPIAGALVWCGLLDSDGRRVGAVRTADDGSFERIVSNGSEGLPVVVEADGYASTFRIVDGLSNPRTKLRIGLEVASIVQVQLSARVEDPSKGVVDLIPETGDSGLRHYPFFLTEFDPERSALDANGVCEIEDLPPSGRVRATVRHPSLAMVREVPIDLRPGASARATIVPAKNLRGRTGSQKNDRRRLHEIRARIVSDCDGGSPIPNARVELVRSAWRATGWILPASSHSAGRGVNADADGLVDLAVFAEPGRDHLRVTAVGHFGLEIELGDEFPDRILLPRADGLRLDSESIPRLRFQFGPLGRRFQLRVSNSDRSGGGSWREWLDFEEFEWPLDAPRLLGLAVHVDPGDGGAVRTHQVPAQLVAGDVEIDLAADPIRARAIR